MASRPQQLLILLVLASVAVNAVHGCGINVQNNCPYMVTTCAQDGNTPIAQYNLGAGQSQFLDFGSGCTWIGGAIWASVGGQCAVSGVPNAAKDRNLADLAEFTIESSVDYYDLSNVNAYTIGLGITVTQAVGGNCASRTCNIPDIRSFCQPPNVLVEEPTGALVCINTDGPGTVPTPGTEQFHVACPEAYSYSKDDSVLRTCDNGSNYQVTFCP